LLSIGERIELVIIVVRAELVPQVIQQMDINPYVVGPKGTTPTAVDARITVNPSQ